MKSRKKSATAYVLMSDVYLQLFIVVLVVFNDQSAVLKKTKLIASEVPGLHESVKGYKGQLDEAEEELENYARDGEEKQGIIDDLEKKVGDQGKQIGQLNIEMQKLSPGAPVDIVFVVDVSGSMTDAIERLKQTMRSLFRWTPRLSSECRIAVLGFRETTVYRFPLTHIRPPSEDSSQQQLMAFMDTVRVKAGFVNHPRVFDEALAMLPDSEIVNRKQVLIVIGDVATSEINPKDGTDSMSAAELQAAKKLVNSVRLWASKGARSAGTIFVGNADENPVDEQWFQALAQPSSQNAASDGAEMFDVVFRAIEQK